MAKFTGSLSCRALDVRVQVSSRQGDAGEIEHVAGDGDGPAGEKTVPHRHGIIKREFDQ